MSHTQPVLELRNPSSPSSTYSSVTLTGSGSGGAVIAGASSTVFPVRLYNNYANVLNVADAINCVLASYDGTGTSGAAVSTPVTGLWLQVQVVDYNASTTNADTGYTAIGGQTKHAVATNSGTLANTGYLTINIQASPPATAVAQSVSQGLWLEYSWLP